MFLLPWMLLARGSSPQAAALATAFVYVPMIIAVVPELGRAPNPDTLVRELVGEGIRGRAARPARLHVVLALIGWARR